MYAKAINTLQWILTIQQVEKGEQTCQRIIEETCVELQKKVIYTQRHRCKITHFSIPPNNSTGKKYPFRFVLG